MKTLTKILKKKFVYKKAAKNTQYFWKSCPMMKRSTDQLCIGSVRVKKKTLIFFDPLQFFLNITNKLETPKITKIAPTKRVALLSSLLLHFVF